jgi:hypothetical protein
VGDGGGARGGGGGGAPLASWRFGSYRLDAGHILSVAVLWAGAGAPACACAAAPPWHELPVGAPLLPGAAGAPARPTPLDAAVSFCSAEALVAAS